MENNTFTFHISPYHIETLYPQLSRALETRTEMLSRERYPQLWGVTDSLNEKHQHQSGEKMSRVKSIVFLLVGIFLLVPGIMKPQELLVPLLFGVVGVVAGIRGLLGNRKPNLKRMKRRFDASAKQLLAGKDSLTEKDLVDISFTEEGMAFPSGEGETTCVSYGDFECIVEMPDGFLLVFDTAVTVLQKRDLQGGEFEKLREFLSQRVSRYAVSKSEME